MKCVILVLTATVVWINILFAPYEEWLVREFFRRLNGGE